MLGSCLRCFLWTESGFEGTVAGCAEKLAELGDDALRSLGFDSPLYPNTRGAPGMPLLCARTREKSDTSKMPNSLIRMVD